MYQIIIKRKVEKDLSRIDRKFIDKILDKIELLENNPFPSNSTKLVNTDRTYRLRIGDYRVVYQVDEAKKEIIIYYIRHRKDAYT